MKNVLKVIAIVILLAMLLVFAPSPVSTYDAFAEIVELPLEGAGLPFDWNNYLSDTQYVDPSIQVDIFWGGRIYDTNYVYAVVKIANATQLRTAVAGNRYSGEYTVKGSVMAEANFAVVAINGDYFKHSDHQNGYLIRQGKLIRNRPNKMWDTLIIDQNGNFHTIAEPNKEKVQAWLDANPDLTVVNSFNFGPVLIENGQTTQADFNKVLNHDYIGCHKACQRMAICQLDSLTYLCVTSEGPEDQGSTGLTMNQFVECLREVESKLDGYTIQTAYNLDGGSSCTLVFKNEKINAPTNPKKRALSDIIYFASAWQAE